jgi:hypothetical protein
MSNIKKWTPPSIAELSETLEAAAKDDILNLTLSQDPPPKWLKEHPMVKVKVPDGKGGTVSVPMQYIPVERQRLLAKRIFGMVEIEIKQVQQMFNSVCVTVRLHYRHPVTGEPMYMDGVGGVGVQTDANAVASDMSKIKFDGVMKAAPAAAAYAEKNAYDKLGRVFGGEVQKDAIRFTEEWAMYADKVYNNPTLDDVKEMYDEVRSKLTADEIKNADRIINGNETSSFKKLIKQLQSK